MKTLIDERVRDEGRKGRIAPHHFILKVEWGTHSEAPPEILNDLKNEVLAAAIDHINDHRYRTLGPVTVEAEVDIFTTGISVDPTFGEFEEDLRRQDEEMRAAKSGVPIPGAAPPMPDIEVIARITLPNGTREIPLIFKPGGRRLNVGRAADNELTLNDKSVSKIHAALLMTAEGTLLVADTGSTNGTYLNGRRIAYGESRLIEDGDVVGFGDVEVRLRKSEYIAITGMNRFSHNNSAHIILLFLQTPSPSPLPTPHVPERTPALFTLIYVGGFALIILLLLLGLHS